MAGSAVERTTQGTNSDLVGGNRVQIVTWWVGTNSDLMGGRIFLHISVCILCARPQ